ncbi:uncharacterized protein [Lolium perenne]|uniref:uncharacterized protein isoform X2 n=1 Tax=Lolium perenne TaxID=4522 RepID=UPI0021F618EB|nr:uncharacterized protein LOC127301615 isoform X2 [Lolium perenne]
MAEPPASACPAELDLARARCRALHDRLAASPALPRHPALRSLLRLVAAELRFLTNSPDPATSPRPLSSNLPHLGALHRLLTHPAVRAPSRLAPRPGVDFACAFRSRAAWVLLSGRNPSGLRWAPRRQGLRPRVAAVLDSARSAPPATRPEKLLLAFARGVGADVVRGLAVEFGAVEIDLLAEFVDDTEDDKEEEDGWVSVSFHPDEEMRSFRAFEIDVVDGGGAEALSPPPPPAQDVNLDVRSDDTLEGCFGDFLGKMRMDSMELLNLDTTALVAIVSGISNGGVGKLMSAPEAETRGRFKCNYKFVMDQAQSELQYPIFVELGKAVDGKKCIICETVSSEFTEIASMCGGPDEKTRASQLLKKLILGQSFTTHDGSSNNKEACDEKQSCLWYR